MTTEPEMLDDVATLDEIEDITKAVDVAFVSTGSDVKDRTIKGIFADAPLLIRKANKLKKWEDICKAVNPMGEAEKFAVLDTLGDKVTPTTVSFIVKAVKCFLMPLRLSVIEAYQKSVLIDQLKRVDIAKAVAKYTPRSEFLDEEPEAAVTETPEEPEAAVTLKVTKKGDKLIREDGATYTIGQRGRKPAWVIEWEKQPVQTVKDSTPTTITHTDGSTYTFGQRGRKPAWVIDWEKKQK